MQTHHRQAERWHDVQLVARVDEILRTQPDVGLYGLIDGTGDSQLVEPFFLLEPEAAYEPPFLGTALEHCLPLSPYLIELPNAPRPFLQQWGCLSHFNAVWYLSAFPLFQQAEHWRSLIHAITPEGSSALFRFWNGSILTPYVNACSAEEVNALLAPCSRIFLPHPQRQWQEMLLLPPDSGQLQTGADNPWWQIQAAHLAAFQPAFERLLVEELQDRVWREHPQALAQVYPARIPALISQVVQQARAQGCAHEQEISHYVLQVFAGFHPQ